MFRSSLAVQVKSRSPLLQNLTKPKAVSGDRRPGGVVEGRGWRKRPKKRKEGGDSGETAQSLRAFLSAL